MQSEQDIIHNIQQGHDQDFVLLYDKYAKKIFDFIFFKVGNKQEAEDLTSDVFLKAFEKRHQFDTKKYISYSNRLYTIAKNQTIDYFRKQKEQYEYERLEDLAIHEDILQNIQDRDKLQSILDFLDTLGQSKKELFILRIWNQLSYEEIAHILGKKPNACKVEFHRTLQPIIQKFGIAALIMIIHL